MKHSIEDKDRIAIVLANFGTTVPAAVRAITNIPGKIKMAFPDQPFFPDSALFFIDKGRALVQKKYVHG